ncbi:MAG: phenylphosphate carboxylase subunit delta [Planctomycetota bacterium]|nr:MAG: phenylphosphate carboxylase subunit delta [Planctomycetota bacterium]REJ97149.1 MAG: phenylphosphate carboxylase subunit delta [Planctomycetota bacterium]REK27958.1 MAG: phenylphosphate carboxylase subunit delta [Planctomycetota bacterium]REK48724.1 MAG: phenylphosphate carboxylase subunit delta [Planctomycetota bacterium]
MLADEALQSIRLILSDVDGVMTDGGIDFDNQGIETKRFHIRDGLGIRMWQKAGHRFGIVTGRSSHIVQVRAGELGVDVVRQGVKDKTPAVRQIIEQLELAAHEVCYIGDDLPDLGPIGLVGLGVAVGDAAAEVRNAAAMTTQAGGGDGAVREVVERLLKAQHRWDDLVSAYTR